MKKLSSRQYTYLFTSQVKTFLLNHLKEGKKAFTTPLKIALAISGGPDSVALLYFCQMLKFQYPNLSFCVLHFNHLSRPSENEREEIFVKDLCLKLCFPFHGKKNSSKNKGQSESSWRQQRYQFFQERIQSLSCHYLWLAHHLDDSFEWSQMQQAKSGHIKGCLGIPVANGKIFRPFLSVTKQHIYSYLKHNDLSFMKDSSNDLDHFERNWWRIHVLNKIKKKYPSILKHYVQRSTELALELNLYYRQTPPAKKIILDSHNHLFEFSHSQRIQDSQHLIKKSLHDLSSKQRMKIRKQMQTLFQAYDNGKKGPISFSGGVKIYLRKNVILLNNQPDFNSDTLKELLERKNQEKHNKGS
jgi:tRNA(Ile)-lysidine synthase